MDDLNVDKVTKLDSGVEILETHNIVESMYGEITKRMTPSDLRNTRTYGVKDKRNHLTVGFVDENHKKKMAEKKKEYHEKQREKKRKALEEEIERNEIERLTRLNVRKKMFSGRLQFEDQIKELREFLEATGNFNVAEVEYTTSEYEQYINSLLTYENYAFMMICKNAHNSPKYFDYARKLVEDRTSDEIAATLVKQSVMATNVLYASKGIEELRYLKEEEVEEDLNDRNDSVVDKLLQAKPPKDIVKLTEKAHERFNKK